MSSGFHGETFSGVLLSCAAQTEWLQAKTAANNAIRRNGRRRILFLWSGISTMQFFFLVSRNENSAIDPAWEWCSLMPRRKRGDRMAANKPIFTGETFRFFR